MAPVLDFTWVSACLFRLWKRLGLGPVCCPPSPASRLLGRGGITGGEGRWGGCKEKGLLSYSLSPNVSQRTGLFCSSPDGPALPAASRHLPTSSSTERRVLPDTSRRQNPSPWAGVRQKTKEKNPPFPPLSLPSPRPKTVNTVAPASCVLPVPCAPARPLVLAWNAVWEGGKEESPWLPSWNMLARLGCVPQGGISEGKG